MFEFNDSNIYKAIDNYVNKIVVIDSSDQSIITEKILNYYNLEKNKDNLLDYYIVFNVGFDNLYNKLYTNPNSEIIKILFLENLNDNIYENIGKLIFFDSFKEYKQNEIIFKQSIENNIIDKFLFSSEEAPDIFLFMIELFSEKSFGKSEFLNYITFFELILTHNPNCNRFNVEDSIMQQFIQKIAACVCLSDELKNEKDLKLLKSELKLIYNYRSDILHGNFNKTNDNLDKFLNLPYYRRLINTEYQTLQKYTAIEFCILNRLNYFFRIVFNIAAEKPLFIKSLK